MPTPRQIRAQQRIMQAARARAERRAKFLVRWAKRHEMYVESSVNRQYSCTWGLEQLVGEIRKGAGYQFYKSMACTGCEVGRVYLRDHEWHYPIPLPDEPQGCITIKNNWLVARPTDRLVVGGLHTPVDPVML